MCYSHICSFLNFCVDSQIYPFLCIYSQFLMIDTTFLWSFSFCVLCLGILISYHMGLDLLLACQISANLSLANCKPTVAGALWRLHSRPFIPFLGHLIESGGVRFSSGLTAIPPSCLCVHRMRLCTVALITMARRGGSLSWSEAMETTGIWAKPVCAICWISCQLIQWWQLSPRFLLKRF